MCSQIQYKEHQEKKMRYSYFSRRFVERLGIESRLPGCLHGALCTRAAPLFAAWLSGLSLFDSPFPSSHLSLDVLSCLCEDG